MHPYSEHDAHSCADHLPRTISGGLALPPRRQPLDPAPAVAFATPPDELTTIFASIRDTFTNVVDSLRRAAASRGIS